MLNKKAIIPIVFLISIVFISGCSFVRIQNVSESSVTVSVNVPDSGASSTRNIQSGGIVDVFSAHGGRYTVTMMPSQGYRELLDRLKEDISKRLFEERETLSVEDVTKLVENLNQIDRLIEDLAKPMPSCSGRLPDFETVVATVSYDFIENEFFLSCGSGPE